MAGHEINAMPVQPGAASSLVFCEGAQIVEYFR